MTTDNLSKERMDGLIAEARQIAQADPEHEWDRRALEWPLTSESVVVEVGGYKGRWAYQIAERYNPRLYVFEPQDWAAAVCRGVLEGYNAQVFNYGLSAHAFHFQMQGWGTDGCRVVDVEDPAARWAEFHFLDWVFTSLELHHVDLMLMNIEGYEYTLLPYMLDNKILPDRLIVQFHTFADPDGTKLKNIRRRLSKHYTVAWDYGPTLIAWQRKGL